MAERTFNFTNERISAERISSEHLADGRHVVKVTPEGVKILATIVKGKITSYEAEDDAGYQRSLFIVRERTPAPRGETTTFESPIPSDLCWICVDSGFGSPICYQDFCEVVAELTMLQSS